MPNIFFTADTHFAHNNIRIHCNRPFKTCDEMDEKMIENWNSVVTGKDEVYILGDFAWRKPLHYLMALKGKKHLLIGNHDRVNKQVLSNFTSVNQIYQRAIAGKLIIMCHYPMRSWNAKTYGSWMLHGHCHCRMSLMKNTMDVGVDGNNFLPYSYEDVCKKMGDINAKFKAEKRCGICGNSDKWVTTADEERCGICGASL